MLLFMTSTVLLLCYEMQMVGGNDRGWMGLYHWAEYFDKLQQEVFITFRTKW